MPCDDCWPEYEAASVKAQATHEKGTPIKRLFVNKYNNPFKVKNTFSLANGCYVFVVVFVSRFCLGTRYFSGKVSANCQLHQTPIRF